MSKEAMKLALEALVLNNKEWKALADSGDYGCWSAEDQDHYKQANEAIKALEEALAKQEQRCEYCDGTGDVHDQTGEWRGVCVCEAGAKQEQGESVAIVCNKGPKFHHVAILTDSGKQLEDGAKLYTTPQQRKPLTDEEIEKCYETTRHYQTLRPQDRFAVFALARAIEAAHGIKE